MGIRTYKETIFSPNLTDPKACLNVFYLAAFPEMKRALRARCIVRDCTLCGGKKIHSPKNVHFTIRFGLKRERGVYRIF